MHGGSSSPLLDVSLGGEAAFIFSIARGAADPRTRDLAEWEVRFDPRFVGLIDPRHFAEVPLALGILSGKQMTP